MWYKIGPICIIAWLQWDNDIYVEYLSISYILVIHEFTTGGHVRTMPAILEHCRSSWFFLNALSLLYNELKDYLFGIKAKTSMYSHGGTMVTIFE